MKTKKLKNPNDIGIYCFYCIENKKLYIGSSECLKHRISQHKSMLRGNYHNNNYLQNAWNKYGENSFKIFTIENCDKEKLLAREKLFIYNLNALIPNGFNISSDTIAPMSGLKHTKETLKKLSEAASGNKNPMFGRQRTSEEKAIMSVNRKAAVTQKHRDLLSKLASKKTGDKNPFFGKKHSLESKLKCGPPRKLNPEQVKEVLDMLNSGCLQEIIAAKFNVGRHIITHLNKKRKIK